MNAEPGRSSPSASERWEYRVSPRESIGALLDRIRQGSARQILLDISAHPALRRDGSLRRTLTTAATEAGKQLTFSLVGAPDTDPSVPKSSPPASAARSSRASAKVPVTVLSSAASSGSSRPTPVDIVLPRLGHSGKRIALFFAFLAGILITIALFFLAPRATIVIDPVIEPITTDLTLRLSSSARAVDITAGIVPAIIQHEEEVVDVTAPVTTVVEKGDPARGSVRIINRTGATQQIRGGSRLVTAEGAIFRMERGVAALPGEETTVPVVADRGGESGNLASGTLLTFAALPESASTLFARTEGALSGGTTQRASILSQEDITRAVEETRVRLEPSFRDRVRAKLPPDMVVRDDLFRLRVLDARPREKIGSETAEVHLQVHVRGELLAASHEHLQQTVHSLLVSRTEDAKVLGRPIRLDDIRLKQLRWDEGIADLDLHVENVLHAAFDLPRLQKDLLGRTQDGAEEFLGGLAGIKQAEVSLQPFWVRRIPSVAHNVRLTIRLPEASGEPGI